MAPLPAAPADVLAVWTGAGFTSNMIRVRAVLRGKPGVANHVIIVTHQDDKARWIGIEGKPGGVGLVDCTPFLADSRTRSNHGQPRADDGGQMTTFLASCAKSLGLRYDWVGIGMDATSVLHLDDATKWLNEIYKWPTTKGELPGAAVCSSLAAAQYANVDWARPQAGEERTCSPGDWWEWNDRQLWTQA